MSFTICSLLVRRNLFSSILRINQIVKPVQICSITNTRFLESNKDDNDVTFGVGSNYIDLDSKSRRNKSKSGNNDADKFGTLTNALDDISFKVRVSTSVPTDEVEYAKYEDPNEVEEKRELSNVNQPNTAMWYGGRLNKLGEERNVQGALDLFYKEMIEKDRFKPDLWLYSIIIKICARCGKVNKAFEILEELDKSGEVDFEKKLLHRLMTTMFLHCRFVKTKELALEKINYLRSFMSKHKAVPNIITYSAMISAYGIVGETQQAFKLVDELVSVGLKPDKNIYHNLLFACASDEKYGFKRALYVWQKCWTENLNWIYLILA